MSADVRAAVLERVATVLYRTGATSLLARVAGHISRGPAFPILTYHRVNDARDPFFPSVPTEIFEHEIGYLARSHVILTVEDLAERMRHGRVPRNALAITFDDGYRDTLTHAAPILARHGVPATVFLATGLIGAPEAPWYERLALGVKLSTVGSLVTAWGDTVTLDTPEDRLSSRDRILRHLKGMPDELRRENLEGILDQLGATDERLLKNIMLSWDDVHALRGLGFAIGAHTVTHPILSRVTPERAWREIRDSRTMIESACGIVPRAFAYPNGRVADYSDAIVDLVKRAGFTCAVTTRFGLNTSRTSPWELHRGGPWEEHLPTYALKLAWYRTGRS